MAIPQELLAKRVFGVWSWYDDFGVRSPVHHHLRPGSGQPPKLTFEQATAAVAAGKADGVGIVLGRGLVAVEIDTRDECAYALVRRIGSYAEHSPNGGVTILARAKLPAPWVEHDTLRVRAEGFVELTGWTLDETITVIKTVSRYKNAKATIKKLVEGGRAYGPLVADEGEPKKVGRPRGCINKKGMAFLLKAKAMAHAQPYEVPRAFSRSRLCRLLPGLCWHLHLMLGGRAFVLPQRALSIIYQVNQKTISDWIQILVEKGLIVCVSAKRVFNHKNNKAYTYRWVAQSTQPVVQQQVVAKPPTEIPGTKAPNSSLREQERIGDDGSPYRGSPSSPSEEDKNNGYCSNQVDGSGWTGEGPVHVSREDSGVGGQNGHHDIPCSSIVKHKPGCTTQTASANERVWSSKLGPDEQAIPPPPPVPALPLANR
jgi:hypothetical protein